MKDREIRQILISWLRAKGQEMRIYQEKSIGNSICDVMVVTDRLTGYEIKSDGDNYARLTDQIAAYDLFFDENYIVVGRSHATTASEKVPPYWGIICVEADQVTVHREAKPNKSVSRRKQLAVLWKLELKNILLKNDLPLYAQKDKGYIADRIVDAVDDKFLAEQIACELLNRDYSVYDATDYSIHTEGLKANMPTRELVDMLSEEDLDTYTLDKWIELYKKAREIREKKETIFVSKPKEPRVPHEIPYTGIQISLGAPWIGVDIIEDFVEYIVGHSCRVMAYLNSGTVRQGIVRYEPITGNWFVESKKLFGSNTNCTVKYGTERYNALYIIEATLNLRGIKLYDRDRKYDEVNTIAALEKQKRIEREFEEWIWQDEDRRWAVEEAYNRMFAGQKPQMYDGSKLRFQGMDDSFALYPYQKDAVQKILQEKNTLLAFDVGAGKTFIMIAAAMKMRQDGQSRKNLFVVPNHIVGQWEKIFTDLYPRAKVLAIEPKSFKPDMRQKVLRQIREGDYDGIIIAYSCFELIPLSTDSVLSNMDVQLQRLEEAIRSLRTSNRYDWWTSRVLEEEKKRIAAMTQDFISSMSVPIRGEISFEDLDISTLFLDEAHNYKNLPIKTKLKNLNGINTSGSSKCLDMLHKVRCVQRAENGRGVVFATGTPLCNSISDAYVMQVYLQFETLEKSHLDVFDNWVKTFAKPEQRLEIDVDTSKYRMIRKFTRFHNLPELSRLFSQIAIFYAVSDRRALPRFEGYTDVVVKTSKALGDYMRELCERTDVIRAKEVDRKSDNMLKVSTDGRKAALDLRLVDRAQPKGSVSKLWNCVANTIRIYNTFPQTSQLIFCDYATPKPDQFNVYQELKSELIKQGIPENEIAFIHSYNTESRKLALFRKVNAAEIRVLIGSTFKLGIGANVQTRLKAIHHLDVPWRPADMVQREGRIIRQGNENGDVLIYRYVSEGSFDAYSWQILETKQRFISQFLSGSSYQRSVTDLEDNVLTYAEVKALALAQPLMKQLAEKENEVGNLRIVVAKEQEARENMKAELEVLQAKFHQLLAKRGRAMAIFSRIQGTSEDYLLREMRRLAGTLTADFVMGKEEYRTETALYYNIKLPAIQNDRHPIILLCDGGIEYPLEMGKSASGNARRLLNMLKGFDKIAQKCSKESEDISARITDLKEAMSKRDESNQRKLRECEKDLEDIRTLIQMNLDKDGPKI